MKATAKALDPDVSVNALSMAAEKLFTLADTGTADWSEKQLTGGFERDKAVTAGREAGIAKLAQATQHMNNKEFQRFVSGNPAKLDSINYASLQEQERTKHFAEKGYDSGADSDNFMLTSGHLPDPTYNARHSFWGTDQISHFDGGEAGSALARHVMNTPGGQEWLNGRLALAGVEAGHRYDADLTAKNEALGLTGPQAGFFTALVSGDETRIASARETLVGDNQAKGIARDVTDDQIKIMQDASRMGGSYKNHLSAVVTYNKAWEQAH